MGNNWKSLISFLKHILILWVLVGVMGARAGNKHSLVKYVQETLSFTKLNEFLYGRLADGSSNIHQ